MKRLIGAVGAAVLVLALHAPAQGMDLRIGGNVNYGTTNEFGLGPRVELDFGDYVPGLRLAWDYHKYFDTNVYSEVDGLVVESRAWDTGLHVVYDFATVPIAQGATLYGGAGVLYAKRTYDHWLEHSAEEIPDSELRSRHDKLLTLQEKFRDDSGASFALTVGSTFITGWTVIPFVEARYTFGVVDELLMAAGILFSTGSGSE